MACKNSRVETSVYCRKYIGLTKVHDSSSISSYLLVCVVGGTFLLMLCCAT